MNHRTFSGLALSSARALRSFVFTTMAIIAPYFLGYVGLNYIGVGLIIALSGVVSTIFVYVIPRLNIPTKSKLLMVWGLMVTAFVILYVQESVLAYIIALLAGGIPLSGKDMSPNQAIEQYSIGRNAQSQKEKNTMFSYYSFLSYAGNTVAAVFLFFYAGFTFEEMFGLCLAVSALSGIPYIFHEFPKIERTAVNGTLSESTRKLRNVLGTLFSVDSFGGGLINSSMLSLWFLAVYGTTLAQIGFIFIIVNILSAVSILISARISTRIGMVRTMVYTHLISNAFLLLMPLLHMILFSEAMLFARQATSQMDVPPRDSFINTVIPEEERMRTNSQFIAIRNMTIIPAPAIGGVLADTFPQTIPFLAGAIKAVYDVGFFARFHRNRD